jgi:Methyltransferase domain
MQGDSSEGLATFPDGYFDMIYIDGDHFLEGVRKDVCVANKKLKSNGVIAFNDYIMFDHCAGSQYGVIQNVNELIDSHGYEVIGFALEENMFADIAVRRITA